MDIIVAKIVLTIAGTWAIQDGIASIWHYYGKEKWSNHAFRLARLGFGIATIIVAVNI